MINFQLTHQLRFADSFTVPDTFYISPPNLDKPPKGQARTKNGTRMTQIEQIFADKFN